MVSRKASNQAHIMSQHHHQVQTQSQRQNQFLIQQKLQLLHLMHLSNFALEEHIRMQLEENPALEKNEDINQDPDEILVAEDRKEHEARSLNDLEAYYNEDDYPDYKTMVSNYSRDDDKYTAPIASSQSFQEQLKDQIKEFKIPVKMIPLVNYLIDSLDEDGYLRRELSDIADDYGFAEGSFIEENELTEALSILQKLDPPGIGARSLRECLLLQLARKPKLSEACKLAEKILENHFQELSTRNFDKICRVLEISHAELKEALSSITHLSPKPVFRAERGESQNLSILPEFFVNISDDDLEIGLANNPGTALKINDEFENKSKTRISGVKQSRRHSQDAVFFKKKVEEAKWFIDALQQREKTLMDIMKAIARLQRDYFLSGDKKDLKPMILQNVADITGYDLSTISRVTSNKYVQTPYGNVLLKDVFSNSVMSDSGKGISAKEIKQEIKELVEREAKDHPLTDFDIVAKLKEKGFPIARRTVVKYRESLNIPNARLRKALI